MAENDDLKQKSLTICSDFLQGPWKNISVEDMAHTELKGGFMNNLFRCALPKSALEKISTKTEDIPNEVLVRFYGPQQENEEFLVREVVIFTILSERNIGPKLYGVFANGRLEQYLPSEPTSNWYDYSELYADVAKELAKFHSLEVPIKKSPALEDHISEWLEAIKKIAPVNTPGHFTEIISNGEFEREFTWLIKEVKKLGAKIVFCHNDLQGGNVLRLKNPPKELKKRVILVDYEFSAYNYRSFDIADYFVEKCFDYRNAHLPNGFKYNYDNYPSKNEREKFVDAYLEQFQKDTKKFENDSQKEEEKKKILEEISLLKLGPCLYWTMVSLKAQLNPHIEFPFWEVGSKVWELYKKFKEEMLQDKKHNGI